MCLALHVNMLGNQETVRMYIPSYLYYLNGSKPRTHSFEAVWWSSCLRFKRCTMVPNSSCRHLADFDDDTFAKTWLHDVNTTLMKFSERAPNHLSGCPFRPVTPKKGQSLRA